MVALQLYNVFYFVEETALAFDSVWIINLNMGINEDSDKSLLVVGTFFIETWRIFVQYMSKNKTGPSMNIKETMV